MASERQLLDWLVTTHTLARSPSRGSPHTGSLPGLPLGINLQGRCTLGFGAVPLAHYTAKYIYSSMCGRVSHIAVMQPEHGAGWERGVSIVYREPNPDPIEQPEHYYLKGLTFSMRFAFDGGHLHAVQDARLVGLDERLRVYTFDVGWLVRDFARKELK